MSDTGIKEQVLEKLRNVQDPELERDIVSLGMIKNIAVQESQTTIDLEVTTPSEEIKSSIRKEIETRLADIPGIAQLQVNFLKPTKQAGIAGGQNSLPGIKHVVAVASGKGGVGKSTVSTNLALALAAKGLRVGLMDGDIYGPNIPLMLGVASETKPTVAQDERMNPIEVQGIKMISMGNLIPPDQPMVWRGPMLHSAVTQFLQKVAWGELDFLLIDLPPGTGDVQLSLVQTVPLSGAVIVTTPQEVALMDVRKGVAMFQKTNVPILGVVENMVGEVFGRGGGKKAAEQFAVPFLGEVPLDAKVREGGDAGSPIVISNSDSEASKAFVKAASMFADALETA